VASDDLIKVWWNSYSCVCHGFYKEQVDGPHVEDKMVFSTTWRCRLALGDVDLHLEV